MKSFYFMHNILVSLLLLFGCQAEPQPIAYGTDNCHHCKMTISDKRYGSEIVTQKGKAFKFDSVECMAAYLHENTDAATAQLLLVTDYSKPGTFTDAKNAIYLQSPQMPSPMGMFLTAFEDKNTAEQFVREKEGKLLTWAQTQKVVANHGKHH